MNSQVSSAGGMAPPDVAAQRGTGVELTEIMRILTERRWVIASAALAGLILGLVATVLMTPLYRATAMLELNTQATELLDGAARSGGQPTARGANQEILQTQVGLLQSESLARRVVQDLNLAASPAFGGDVGSRQQRTDRAVSIVRGGTTVETIRNSLLIRVHQVATDPADAARIANALSSGLISSGLERRYDSSAYARRFLSDQLTRTKTALEDSERTLNAYALESGVFRAPGTVVDGRTTEGATLASSDLTEMNRSLNEARVRRITAEQAWRNTRVEFSADQAANVSALVAQRTELEAQYQEKLRIFKPEYPQMRELRTRIDELDRAINSERGRFTRNRRAELQGEFQSAQRAEAQLRARVDAAKRDVQSERVRSVQYNILQREADTNRAQYDALLQRYKEVGVAGGIGQSNVSMVDQAEPPAGSFRPRLPVNAAVGLLAGLAAGIGLAFALHLLFDAIVDPADVRNKLHLPVLGVIPMETEFDTLFEALADRKSDVSEAYYSVRTALKFARPEGAPKTLLVTSTRPGEGKSTSAYAIASSMARLGSKVLLIDADLRKPTFVSSREDGYGLAHLLGTEEPLNAYAEKTQVENLDLLPVGRFVGSAAELLSSNRLPAIMAEARDIYEMVVIDGPPVLGLTDAPLLSSVAEATTLVIESRLARTSNVAEMARRLKEAGANLIGVILTKVSTNGGGYGYGYYSYSYGGDGVSGKVTSNPARALNLGKAGNKA